MVGEVMATEESSCGFLMCFYSGTGVVFGVKGSTVTDCVWLEVYPCACIGLVELATTLSVLSGIKGPLVSECEELSF